MHNAVRCTFLLSVFLILGWRSSAQPVEVRILQADEVSRDPDVVEGQRLIGHVMLAVGSAEVACDSAWRYPEGLFRLMGHVVAQDGAVDMLGMNWCSIPIAVWAP